MHSSDSNQNVTGRPMLRVGRWRVDPSADEIEADGGVVKLEPQNMRLLLALAERPGQVVTIQELLDRVWQDLIVTQNSVYQAVAQLRKQLGDPTNEPEYIQTVHRKGYRLIAAVYEELAPPAAAVQTVAISTVASPQAVAAGSVPMDVTTSASASQSAPDASPVAPVGANAATARPSRRLVLGASAAAMFGVGMWVAYGALRKTDAVAMQRLAVLPFVDNTPGRVERALARGLALDVSGVLGGHHDVQVVAADSVLAVEEGTAPGEVARRLNVRFLLLGELLRAASTVRVSARLVEPPRAEPLWQRDFEQPAGLISQLPAEIARQAAAALGLSVSPTPSALPPPGAAEAYELYVLGNDAWRPKTTEAFAKARGYFQRGIEVDPSFARNHVGLGWTWIGQATTGAGLDLPRAIALATPSFDKALRLEPDAAEALTAMATLHEFAGEYDVARRLLKRAIGLNPNYAQAHHSLGIVEFDGGLPQRAQEHFRRAASLNPLNASPIERLALSEIFAGQLDAAPATARKAIELEPKNPAGHWMLGIHGYASGDLVQAVNAYRQALERESRRPFLWHELGWLYLDLELFDAAAEAFARTVQQLPGVRWPAIYAAFGWAANSERKSVPAAITIDATHVPEDGSAIELMQVRLLGGLAADAALLRRALEAAAGRNESLSPEPWFVFLGQHRLLDLAAVWIALGDSSAAAPHLIAVERQLDELERNGNRWHALFFHRARLAAMRGKPQAALVALESAIAGGSRRAWWLRADPAFATLRSEPKFAVMLDRIDAHTARQRRQLGF